MKRELLAEYRAARMIRQRLESIKPQVLCLDDVNQALNKCNHQRSRLAMAIAKGWNHAATDSMQRLSTSLEELQRSIDRVTRTKNTQAYVCPPVSDADIFQDLHLLRREFVEVDFNLKLRTLTVHTEEITLEDISLGSFVIKLHWGDNHGSLYYRVDAITPNPSATNSEVTHPHVQAESLCEGEGSTSIKRALKDGRLFDFFCIVDRILKSYNPDSAYVELNDWRGIECGDCGQRTDSSETQCCDRCNSDLCGSCARGCEECHTTRCSDCIGSCHDCGNDCCEGCLEPCIQCDSEYCSNCLTQRLCNDCFQEEDENDPDESASADSAEHALATPAAEIHAVCVEQASVLT